MFYGEYSVKYVRPDGHESFFYIGTKPSGDDSLVRAIEEATFQQRMATDKRLNYTYKVVDSSGVVHWDTRQA